MERLAPGATLLGRGFLRPSPLRGGVGGGGAAAAVRVKCAISEDSTIEQLPQHLVHGRAVLRGIGRWIALRRWRWLGRGGRTRRRKTPALAAPAKSLLQQIAQGFAELAELVGLSAIARTRSGRSAQSAQCAAQAAARREQALAHLFHLGIAPIGIAQNPSHPGIDSRLRPRASD